TNVGSSTTGLSFAESVFVAGDYAFIASAGNNTLAVFNVATPASPTSVATSTTGLSSPKSLFVSGRYAYVTSYNNNTLAVFDISGLSVTSIMAHSLEAGTLQIRSNATVGNNLSVTGGINVGNGGINSTGPVSLSGTSSISLSGSNISQTPTNPTFLGGVDHGGTTEATIAVATAGRYAYLGKGPNAGTCSSSVSTGCELQIYDVSNPASPAYVGGFDAKGTILGIRIVGRYAYLGMSTNGSSCGLGINFFENAGCEFQIVDISNPSSPAFTGGFDTVGTGNTGTVVDLEISGGYAYVYRSADSNAATCSTSSRGGCEVQIYSIANPANIAFVGGADNGNTVSGAFVPGKISLNGKYLHVTKRENSGT
ncbi:MAG: hypothetical protein IT440_16560, partial [Phycisphaeraceae bacterium]|nr:hypothetical protein [Phycisphaeraceae bacterium]